MVSGMTKTVVKSGRPGPVFSTKIFQNIQENYGNVLETIFISENSKFWKFRKVCAPHWLSFVFGASEMLKFESLKFCNLIIDNLEFGNFQS